MILKIYLKFVFIIGAENIYLRHILSSLLCLKFWKQNFMYLGHKHVEIGPNSSHELTTFLKYQTPLRPCINTKSVTLP